LGDKNRSAPLRMILGKEFDHHGVNRWSIAQKGRNVQKPKQSAEKKSERRISYLLTPLERANREPDWLPTIGAGRD